MAAHITAASPGGPRWDGSLTSDERKSADNAIWLCQDCAKLIDSDVARYTKDNLRQIKRQAEERASSLLVQAADSYFVPIAGAAHAEIDEASRHITEGRADVGLTLLQKLKRERWDKLTPREKYRVLANIGAGYLRKGEEKNAAHAFLEAATHQSSDDDGPLSVAAHGHLLDGNPEKAYLMASDSCARNPMNERAQIVRLQSAPKAVSYDEILQSVPQALRSNLNVALALCQRAMDENNPAEAERVLRNVQDKSPSLHFSLGAALLQQGFPAVVHEGMRLLPRNADLVREACDHLTKAIKFPGSPLEIISAAHFNRALASTLLGDENGALADLRAAYEKAPNNEDFGIAYVLEASRRGEAVSAINAARELLKYRSTPKGRLILGMTLYDSGGDQEKREALKLLQEGIRDLGGSEPDFRLEYFRRVLDFLHLSGELDAKNAEGLVNQLRDPIEKAIIHSWALHRLGLQAEAEREAKQAAALLGEINMSPLAREVAVLLSRLGLAAEALPIWLEISQSSVLSEDTLNLLKTADSAGRDDLVLDHCEGLRAKGVFPPEIALREVELLVKYNELRKARVVVGQYLRANPENTSLCLALLNIAVVHEWRDILDEYVSPYPEPEKLTSVADGARLVQILHFKGLVQAAASVAYDLVRRFPDDPLSHRSLIISILKSPKGDLALDEPPKVIPGSAVRFRRIGEEYEWIVIEDSGRPEVSRNEYSPDHPLSQALLGKSIGDNVTLPISLVRAKTAVVEEIKHKILFRMHQSLEQMNRWFPEDSFFETVTINFDAEGHELDDLIAVNREISRSRLEAEKLYDEGRAPIAFLARAAGKVIPQVLEAFAADVTRTIHCVDGKAEEFNYASAQIASARELVLDLTALSTIGLLGNDFDISKVPTRCIVSEGALECLRRLGRSEAEDERVRGYMGFDGERITIQEINPEVEGARAARAAKFAERIESICEVVGGRPLAEMDSEARDKLLQIFGQETAESIAIAKKCGCPLWTDDYLTSVLIQKAFAVPRVWTQSVCFWLRDADILRGDECDVISAHLCGFNYQFTSISPRTIIVACGLCGWDPDKQPLQGVLDQFGEYGKEQNMLVPAATLMPVIWRGTSIIDYSTRVTMRVLDKLVHSRNGMATIRSILGRLDVLFGLNVVGAKHAKIVIEAWLATEMRGGRIISG